MRSEDRLISGEEGYGLVSVSMYLIYKFSFRTYTFLFFSFLKSSVWSTMSVFCSLKIIRQTSRVHINNASNSPESSPCSTLKTPSR
jgi:hypothetical protein